MAVSSPPPEPDRGKRATEHGVVLDVEPSVNSNVVLRGFAALPIPSAVAWSAAVFGWIVVGTIVGDRWVKGATSSFVRDGVVRWAAAALLLGLLWIVRDRLPINLLGAPQRPAWFPWATIVLVLAASIRLSVVSQFWDEVDYTAAVFFSELSTGVVEELAFRGLIFGGLLLGLGRGRRGVRLAALITTALFGLVHVSGGWAAIVVTLLFGAVFLLATIEVRSLWPAAIGHGLFDVGVNGAGPVGEEEWSSDLMTFASLGLLLAGIVGLVVMARWSRWPVVEMPDAHHEPGGDLAHP